MGAITDTGAEAFRDHATAGVPSSGVNDPAKSEIRALFATIDGALTSVVDGVVIGGAVVYSTRAALYADLAHVAGKLGVVYNDGTAAYNGVYVKSGGSGSGSWAISNLALPSSFATDLANLLSKIGDLQGLIAPRAGPSGFVIGDAAGNALAVILPTEILHPQIDALQVAADASATAAAAVTDKAGPSGVALGDGNGNAVLYVDKDQLVHPAMQEVQRQAKRAMLYQLFNELTAVFTMSQSLGMGAFSTAPISTTALDYAYKYVGGVRVTEGTTDIPTILASVAAFSETAATISGNSYGETPSGGMAQMLRQLLLTEDGIDLSQERVRLILGVPGTSGTSANSLLTGAAMTTLAAMVAYGLTSGQATGWAFNGCPALAYIQGEQDYVENTDPTLWKGYVRSIRAAVAAQNLTSLGRSLEPVLFPYQLATHLKFSRTTPTIALALLELEAEAHIARVVPTYNLTYYGGDHLHLTAGDSLELGARLGLQMKRRLVDKRDGAGIRAGAATKSGGVVTIPISWIDGSRGNALVQDTSPGTVSNMGFQLVNSGGSAVTITSATIVGASVRLAYSSGTPTEWRYGWAGDSYKGLGQLRDNDPTTFVGQDGVIRRLFNWLPICKGTIP